MRCPDCTRDLKKHCHSETCDWFQCFNCFHFGRPYEGSQGPKRWVEMPAKRQREWEAWRNPPR